MAHFFKKTIAVTYQEVAQQTGQIVASVIRVQIQAVAIFIGTIFNCQQNSEDENKDKRGQEWPHLLL